MCIRDRQNTVRLDCQHFHTASDLQSATQTLIGRGELSAQNFHHIDVCLLYTSYLIERQAHDTRLLGQSLQDRLTNPPHGIRDNER